MSKRETLGPHTRPVTTHPSRGTHAGGGVTGLGAPATSEEGQTCQAMTDGLTGVRHVSRGRAGATGDSQGPHGGRRQDPSSRGGGMQSAGGLRKSRARWAKVSTMSPTIPFPHAGFKLENQDACMKLSYSHPHGQGSHNIRIQARGSNRRLLLMVLEARSPGSKSHRVRF